jgi:hypothetical protein
MKSERNAPCPCGSGKKYKICCAAKRPTSQRIAVLSVVAVVGLGLFVLAGMIRDAAESDGNSRAGQVWSEEHGHWHDAPASVSGSVPSPVPVGDVGAIPAPVLPSIPEIDQVSDVSADE